MTSSRSLDCADSRRPKIPKTICSDVLEEGFSIHERECQYIFDWLVNLLWKGRVASKVLFQSSTAIFPALYDNRACALS